MNCIRCEKKATTLVADVGLLCDEHHAEVAREREWDKVEKYGPQ